MSQASRLEVIIQSVSACHVVPAHAVPSTGEKLTQHCVLYQGLRKGYSSPSLVVMAVA